MYNAIVGIVGTDNVLSGEEMKKHTTFRVGGKADYFVTPESAEQIGALIQLCREKQEAYYIMGNGSNLLVPDEGIRGVVIQILQKFSGWEIRGNMVKAQAGIPMSALAKRILEAELTGFECLSGIPGTLGGAVAMNAGAYGSEIKDIFVSATVLDAEGNIRNFSLEEMKFGYRRSSVTENSYIMLEAELKLQKGVKSEIKQKMDKFAKMRMEKQPLEYPSAGSTFKRPEGYFAGKLIMDAGLAGYTVGGAKVSEKHCGFVINAGNATAADVLAVIRGVQKTVFDKFGVKLETEVKILGNESERMSEK